MLNWTVGRGSRKGSGFREGRGGGCGSEPFWGLEDLLSPYLPFLLADPNQQPELQVDRPEPEASQEMEPVEASAPEGGQDGEIPLMDGSEPADEIGPGPEVESEVTAELTAVDSEPGPSDSDQQPELEVDQPEPEAGQDLQPVKGSEPFKDAGGSQLASSVIVSSRSRTRFTIAGLDRLFGTGRDDRIRGSRRAEFVMGRRGGDKLTGGGGSDRFGFRWGDSRIWAPDRITDFSFGEDKILLFGRRSRLHGQPLRLSRAADNSTATSLQQLSAEVFADADGRRAGNQALRRRSAVLVQATNRRIRGTYLLINNNNPDLNLRRDLMVKITGFSGDLPDFGRIDAATVFG